MSIDEKDLHCVWGSRDWNAFLDGNEWHLCFDGQRLWMPIASKQRTENVQTVVRLLSEDQQNGGLLTEMLKRIFDLDGMP